MLKEEFEQIIVDSPEYVNEEITIKKLEEWKKIKNIHQRATKTYQFVLNNSISKAIIAQKTI